MGGQIKWISYILVLFLLIYAIPQLNIEITTQADSPNATRLEEFSGDVFPLFLSALPLAWVGVMIYDFYGDVK